MDAFGEAAAREAATHWGFAADAALELLCISENATYLVGDRDDAAERGVLRLNRPGYHSRQALESEVAWTAALRREGVVTTPAALRTRQGDHVAVLDAGPTPRHAVMFSFVAGSAPTGSSGAMPPIGQIAAQLHAHSRRWTRPEGFCRFTWDLPAVLGDVKTPGRWGDWRAGVRADVSATLEAAQQLVVARLTDYGQGRERFGLIHGDLRAANLLVDGETVTVIDFDDSGFSWYGSDIAAAVSFLEHRAELAELVTGFLAGYRRSGWFGPADVSALPSLIMLRRIQLLAWSASHADTEMVRSLGPDFAAQSAEVADKYLSGRLLAGVS